MAVRELTSEQLENYRRIVVETIPADNWREIAEHRHNERVGRLIERLHPGSTFVLPNSGEAHAGTQAFLHALEQLVRIHHHKDPDEVFTYMFTSVAHPELITQGFTDQAEVELKLRHADVLKEIKAEHLEAGLEKSLRHLREALGSDAIQAMPGLASVSDAERRHLSTNIDTAHLSLNMYIGDAPIPFSEVMDNLRELLEARSPRGTPGVPVNLPDATSALNYRITQGHFRGDDLKLAQEAAVAGAEASQQIEGALATVDALKALGVGRWDSRHISH